MDVTELMEQIQALPEEMQQTVAQYVEFLAQKAEAERVKAEPRGKGGLLRSMFDLSKNYDEPFDD